MTSIQNIRKKEDQLVVKEVKEENIKKIKIKKNIVIKIEREDLEPDLGLEVNKKKKNLKKINIKVKAEKAHLIEA